MADRSAACAGVKRLYGNATAKMSTNVELRLADDEDMDAVAALALRVFDECVAPLYSPEGRESFRRIAIPEAFRERSRTDHLTLVAECNGQIMGMLELRQWGHVAMLFVDRGHQRRGVGRKLVQAAAGRALHHDAATQHLTVNSSPNAVEAYRQLGFSPDGPERVEHGIGFLPMVLKLNQANSAPTVES
jgi:GNAT superfamily N-acetyltransferase